MHAEQPREGQGAESECNQVGDGAEGHVAESPQRPGDDRNIKNFFRPRRPRRYRHIVALMSPDATSPCYSSRLRR